ncbi:MAG TPA: Ppx/GppA phosphatase family protein [Candidatus Binataceae bacterium]|nr:Ppx/GppA phosphatase family protein [Candidatus Binataceae bacterium]
MKLAAFDIGTNTTLLLAVETSAGGTLRPILELSRITRLGKGVDKTGALDPEAAQRTLDAIVEFADAARRAGVDRFVAVATSALRDARDGAGFIARARERSGVELKIISGREEAELSHLAVVRGLKIDPSARLLIVDIGGGSTELICAEPGRELQMTSLQMGSVRLTERIIHSDPPSASETAELRSEIDRTLDTLGWNFKPDTLVGIAGTVTTVCAVALEMETYDSARVHGHVLSRAEVSRVAALFGKLPLAERKKLKGLVEGRADVIFAGATILERLMDRFGVDEVIVSDQGVRWGLAWRETEHAF